MRRLRLAIALVPLLLLGSGLARAAPLTVAMGGPADDPAYLPAHAAAALGTFEAEGVEVVLRRARHPTAAIEALRRGEAEVAVTTLDQAIRGGFMRETPLTLLLAHTRAPAVALVASTTASGARLEELRGRRVGIPAPGTTAHLVLLALLRGARLDPTRVEVVSLGGAALAARLASGDLAAAVLDDPWLGRVLATGGATLLADLRRPEVAEARLGGPFYEVVSVVAQPKLDPKAAKAAAKVKKPPEPVVQSAERLAYVRALLRVQTWLLATPATEVADRLPDSLVGDRARFVARLTAQQAAYLPAGPAGEATEDGLAATFRLLQGGTPWPDSLALKPAALRAPPEVDAARAALGAQPPAP
jgi:NitT/TauT family transport system substrate-binding protein